MKAFFSSTTRADIRSFEVESSFSQATSGSLTVVGVGSTSQVPSFVGADIVRSLRADLSVFGTAVLLAAFAPLSTGIVLPQDAMQSRATWSSARRRRRLISLTTARAIAVCSMAYAERVRDNAAAEEARRSSIGELPS